MKGFELTKCAHFVALAALLGSVPLQAASDSGLTLHGTGAGQRNTGVGATVGIRIQLGSDRAVRQSERVKLGIAAGPVMALTDTAALNGVRRAQASFVGFDLRPGYSTSFTFAGNPIATRYTRLGAAEKDKDGGNDAKQSTGSKIGWVALVAGGVVVALVGTYLLSCGAGEGRSCGSD